MTTKLEKEHLAYLKKKDYRGFVVAVKPFKGKASRADVEQEAMMISSFDHPGTS